MKKKEKIKKHNFHFVLNGGLKDKINNLAARLNKSLSKTIIYILISTICILDKFQYSIEEICEISKYPTVNWDVDANVYLDEVLFRKIKHIEGTMHAFGIAVIVRKLLEFYFHFLELSDGDVRRVERIFKRFYLLYVKEIGTKITKMVKSEKKIPQFCGNFLYTLIFNAKYCLTGVDFHKSD